MRLLIVTISVFLFLRCGGQAIPPMWQELIAYESLTDSLYKENTTSLKFQDSLQKRGYLPIYQFNNSYIRSVHQFFQFVQQENYGPKKFDQAFMSPLRYLLSVIYQYEKASGYKVAVLFYTTEDAERPLVSGNSTNIKYTLLDGTDDFLNITHGDQDGNVKLWYLSSKTITGINTGISYPDVVRLDADNRQNLSVSALGAKRSARSGRDTARSHTSNGNPDAARLLQQALLPKAVLEKLEKDSINGVIILPYGTIGQIPFAMLPVSGSEQFIDRYSYFIAAHPLNFGALFTENAGMIGKQNRLAASRPLIVGNPKFTSTEQLILPPLPGAEKEAKLVAERLNTHALIADDADLDRVIDSLSVCDFAYFATHALPSYDNPVGKSFLALTPTTNNTAGFLYVIDLHDMNLQNTKLAVLSGCETGLGKDHRSGYCNIGRAFFIAGVDNTILSLWNLDDENIVPFMTILIEELQKPQYFYPAENLRQAALRFRKTNSNPAYWSAMVNFGVCY